MYRYLTSLTALLLTLTTTALAAPCGIGTLQDYVGLGVGGCTIDDLTFTNFGFSASSSGGPVSIPASGISVTPVNSPALTALDFSSLWSARANEHVDNIITFSVTAAPGSSGIADLGLLQGGSVVSGTGIAAVGETVCAGDSFANQCAGGTVLSLESFMTDTSSMLIDHVTFPAVSALEIIKDIGVTGGPDGFAVLSFVENSVSHGGVPVPEAGTLALVGLGLLTLGIMQRVTTRAHTL